MLSESQINLQQHLALDGKVIKTHQKLWKIKGSQAKQTTCGIKMGGKIKYNIPSTERRFVLCV